MTEQLDNGSKICYLEKHYLLKRATYYRYLKIIIDNKLFESFHGKLLEFGGKPSMLLVDATHIRSINGSEGVNYGYKERSKMAVKVTMLTGFNKVIYLSGLHPDNLNDHVAFGNMARSERSQVALQVLADSGYNGRRFKEDCKSNGYEIISSVKRWRNGPSHVLSNYHKILLRRHRCKVEHVFSQLKRFRGLSVKSNRFERFYKNLLHFGNLMVSIHNGIIRGGLKPLTRIVLKRSSS